MSTSLLYHGFGIREVVYEKAEYEQGKVIIWCNPRSDRICCASCSSKEIIFRGKKQRRFRSLPIGTRAVEIVYCVPRVECRRCGVIRQSRIPFADPKCRYTRPFERYALSLCRCMTIQDVATHLGVSWDVIKQIEKRYLKKHFARPKLKHLRQIAIDEIAVAKGHRYVTVVLDLQSGAVVFVGEGKGAEALSPFWKRVRKARCKIEAVAMDMSPAYQQAVSRHLPQALIVFDRFHVMKRMNDRLSTIRRELYSKMKDQTQREVLKGIRWLLLKNPENLDPEKNEKERLEEALQFNAPLAQAYYLKDLLRQFWECSDDKAAERFLEEWMAQARVSENRHLYGMAKTLERHRQGLLNYYRYPITTAPLEGTNNKIKTLKRQAYGYRDQEFFRLKIMAIHQVKYALVG